MGCTLPVSPSCIALVNQALKPQMEDNIYILTFVLLLENLRGASVLESTLARKGAKDFIFFAVKLTNQLN